MSRVEQIKQLLQSEPDDVFLNFSLAKEYQSAGQLEDAIRQFDRTIELDEKYLAAYVSKSQVLLAERRFDAARSVLEAAAKIARTEGDQHMLDNINETLSHLA